MTILVGSTFTILNAPIIGTKICLLKNPARDVFRIIIQSVKHHEHKDKLLLGDSVCRQIHGRKSTSTMLNLSENQSYEIAGNYILLANLLEHGSSFDTVALYFNPFSLTCDINQIYTYNYFIKPFRPYLDKLDKLELVDIENTFPKQSRFNFLPVVKYQFSNWQLEAVEESTVISSTSMKYLEKIMQLCEESDMYFVFKAMPIKASRQKEVETIASNSQEYLHQYPTLRKYFENIAYLPDSLYLDEAHFINPEVVISKIR